MAPELSLKVVQRAEPRSSGKNQESGLQSFSNVASGERHGADGSENMVLSRLQASPSGIWCKTTAIGFILPIL